MKLVISSTVSVKMKSEMLRQNEKAIGDVGKDEEKQIPVNGRQ